MTKKPAGRGSADTAKGTSARGRATFPAAMPVSMTAQRPFDAWLEKELRGLFDEVATEPLPPDLLALMRKPTDPPRNGSGSGQ